ncbi:MAG: hypothetical protein R2711_10245 [Acidimicrobiales bacterium]
MPIEVESPEELGYETITNNLSRRARWPIGADLGLDLTTSTTLVLCYGDHLGDPDLREAGHGPGIEARHVLVTPEATTALFAVAASTLEPGDRSWSAANYIPTSRRPGHRRPPRGRRCRSTTAGASTWPSSRSRVTRRSPARGRHHRPWLPRAP